MIGELVASLRREADTDEREGGFAHGLLRSAADKLVDLAPDAERWRTLIELDGKYSDPIPVNAPISEQMNAMWEFKQAGQDGVRLCARYFMGMRPGTMTEIVDAVRQLRKK